ncbi:SDR family NAD(P)-dependent oxidoreductase [soil metagenome]
MTDAQRPKLILVTGASGGIGEAFAQILAAEGHALVLVARNERELHRVKGVLAARNSVPIAALPCDLSRPDAVDQLARDLDMRGLIPDIVINNAGFGLMGKAAAVSRTDQLNMIDLNIRALTDLTLRFLPGMIASGQGGILNVASVAGFMPGPNMAVYFATKAFVISFSDALAAEVRNTGVTITSLCPGPVDTGFQARAGMKDARTMTASSPPNARAIAQEGWDGFKDGRRTVIPGVKNKIMAYGLRGAPRHIILPFISRAMARART